MRRTSRKLLKRSLNRFDRRGLVEDLADFLFTVFVVVFLFMFISLALKESVDSDNSATLRILARERATSTVIQETQFNLFLGKEVYLPALDLNIEQAREEATGSDYGTSIVKGAARSR